MPVYDVDKAELKALMRVSGEAFFGLYLGEQLTLAVPDFHLEIWDECIGYLNRAWKSTTALGSVLKKLFGVPRGHAKSTIARLLGIYAFTFTESHFVLYSSDTFPIALAGIKDIKNMLMSKSHQELWGETIVLKSSDSEGLYELRVFGADGRPKDVILKAAGRQTQVRGTLIRNRRPDFLIFDDIESDESANTPEQQAKLDKWAMGAALKAMAPQGFCLFIGNMINERTLLARLSKEDEWNATVFGCIIRVNNEIRSLWPDFRSLESLLEEYIAYRRIGSGHTFEAEMMNLTSSDIFGERLDSALRPEKPLPDEIECGFICLDPAFGLKTYNDDSAITVHVRLRGGDVPILVDSEVGKFGEEELFNRMLAKSYYWGLKTWVIESVAAQKLLIPLFRQYCIQRKIMPEMLTMLPVLAGRESKASRILAFRATVAGSSYGIVEEEETLFQLLEEYTPTSSEHDDLCDSAAYGTIIWNLYNTVVVSNGWHKSLGSLLFGEVPEDSEIDSIAMGIP